MASIPPRLHAIFSGKTRIDQQKPCSFDELNDSLALASSGSTQVMPSEWYVSFHGGEEKTALNNIHVYSTDGKELRKALNKQSLPDG
jgi:hypothetical protein